MKLKRFCSDLVHSVWIRMYDADDASDKALFPRRWWLYVVTLWWLVIYVGLVLAFSLIEFIYRLVTRPFKNQIPW